MLLPFLSFLPPLFSNPICKLTKLGSQSGFPLHIVPILWGSKPHGKLLFIFTLLTRINWPTCFSLFRDLCILQSACTLGVLFLPQAAFCKQLNCSLLLQEPKALKQGAIGWVSPICPSIPAPHNCLLSHQLH